LTENFTPQPPTKFFALKVKVKVSVSESVSETEEGCRVYKPLAGN